MDIVPLNHLQDAAFSVPPSFRCRNGYSAIIELCQRYSADFNFTCVEMKDNEQPEAARCGPESLLKQVSFSMLIFAI